MVPKNFTQEHKDNRQNNRWAFGRLNFHNELNLTNECAKMVRKTLPRNKKDNRKNIFPDISSDLVTNVITCDATWIFQYDPATKCQPMHTGGSTHTQERKKRNRTSQNWDNAAFFSISSVLERLMDTAPWQHVSPQSPIRESIFSKLKDFCTRPTYSPDPTTCDFYLFPKVKSVLKGRHFQTEEKFKAKTEELLKIMTDGELSIALYNGRYLCSGV